MKTEYAERSVYGGNFAAVPLPHTRWFDDKTRMRRVRATVHRYYCGARHYYVDFSIEGDPVWDTSENVWRTAWDDPKAHEFSFGRARKYDNCMFARRFVERVLRRFFPLDKWTHDVDFGDEPEGDFFYTREGD